MRRRDFLKAIGAGAAVLAADSLAHAAPRTPKPKPHPNILWLISESTSPDFACYGNTQIATPNFDRLAGEGALFTRAFATASVGSASRSALLTGMYQTSIGAHNHRSHRDDGYQLPKPVELVTEYFRRAGYFTCNCDGLSYKKPGRTDWNFMTLKSPFDGTDWSQRKKGQPFFAMVSFNLAGRPFERDSRNPIDPYLVDVPECYPDHPIARRDWADYLESVQVLDSQIGVALTWLEREDLASNTIVVYTGETGRPHVRCEQWLYDGGIHIPLMIRWPEHIKPGSVFEGLVSAVDLAPTLLSLAEISLPKHLQGHVVIGPGREVRKYVLAARDRCDETIDRVRCVRSERYKYIRNYFPERPYTQSNGYQALFNPTLTLLQVLQARDALTPPQALFLAAAKPKEEFYDLSRDPLELVNLAGDEAYKTPFEEHSRKLDEWAKATKDQGERPESPALLAAWRQQIATSFQQTMAQRGLSPDTAPEDYLKWWQETLLQPAKTGGRKSPS
jgi:N-sulfoglucosamine sulfohydrolase